jgi:hypothetical protein
VLGRTAVPGGSYNVQGGRDGVLTPSLARGTLAVVRDRAVAEVAVADSCHDACFA